MSSYGNDGIKAAVLVFKLGFAIAPTSQSKGLEYSTIFSFGGHARSDLTLSKEQESFAISALEHAVTNLLAVQLDEFLESSLGNERMNPSAEIGAIALFIRELRNSFAHNPFDPKWMFRGQTSKAFHIPTLLNICVENGKRVKREDYGGPLKLLAIVERSIQIVERMSNSSPLIEQ